MKKLNNHCLRAALGRVLLPTAVLLALLLPAGALAVEPPSVGASGAVLIEAQTGAVIMGVNEHSQRAMASTTKVMTAILAIERLSPTSVVTVNDNASGVEGSSMFLEKGEHITAENLLYGLMLSSGNDAAVALAYEIAGGVGEFAQMMNEKARELGLTNTNFVNPNGLPAEGHYTSAYDLAQITRYALSSSMFREIVSTKYREMPWEGHEWDRVLKNKNKILWQYEGGNGVKTGYTKKAGRCLVASAEKDGMQLIAVVLNCGDMFGDAMKMLDYGFTQVEKVPVEKDGTVVGNVLIEKGAKQSLDVAIKGDIVVTVRKGDAAKLTTQFIPKSGITAPVHKGDELAKFQVLYNGNVILETGLYAQEEIGEATFGYYLDKVLGRLW